MNNMNNTIERDAMTSTMNQEDINQACDNWQEDINQACDNWIDAELNRIHSENEEQE